jgi:hypothetical protein
MNVIEMLLVLNRNTRKIKFLAIMKMIASNLFLVTIVHLILWGSLWTTFISFIMLMTLDLINTSISATFRDRYYNKNKLLEEVKKLDLNNSEAEDLALRHLFPYISEENLKTDQKPGYWIFKILEFTRKKIQLRKELEFPEEISQENREKIISLLATYDLKIPVAAQYKFEEKIYKYLKNKVFPLNNMESFEQYLSLEVKNDIQ